MKTQQLQIEEMLTDEGWRIVSREPGSEWWLDERWILASAWRPVGASAYVSFIVDPQAPFERAKGERVWAVATTQSSASAAVHEAEIPLRPQWERVHREEVLSAIRALRTGAAAGPGVVR